MSNFIVTQIGLDAVISEVEQGFKLVLSSFRIGTAWGYTPTLADTGLHGSTLYTDQITSFRTSSSGDLVATCTMAVDAGPFQFGEIGIYTQAGQLFCLASLDAPMMKYSSLGTNIASTYSFDVYIRLGQATAVIEIDSVTTVTYGQVVSALGFTPYNATNPAGYLTSVTGVTPNSSPQLWSLGVGVPASGVQGQIRSNGSIYTTGDLQGFQTSDPKFKTNVTRIANPLETIRGIGGFFFDWTPEFLKKVGGESVWIQKASAGVMADEVFQHYKVAGRTREDGTLAVIYDLLIPLLIECVRALDTERRKANTVVDGLQKTVADLESRMLALESPAGGRDDATS